MPVSESVLTRQLARQAGVKLPPGIRTSVKITDDRRLFDKIVKQLRIADKSFIKIGILERQGKKPHKGNKTFGRRVAEIATVHEFGSSVRNIPERSWMRGTMDREQKKFVSATIIMYNRILEGKLTTKQALDKLGNLILNRMKNTLRKSIGIKPLKASTIKARLRKTEGRARAGKNAQGGKASPVALVDTSQMLNSHTYVTVIEKKKSREKTGKVSVRF